LDRCFASYQMKLFGCMQRGIKIVNCSGIPKNVLNYLTQLLESFGSAVCRAKS
jgi:hypothetical protein